MQNPLEHLIEIAKFATGVDLKDCSWSVETTHREKFGYRTIIRIHHAPPEMLEEMRGKGIKPSSWLASSGGWYRTWDSEPEEAMRIILFENSPKGSVYEDLIRAEEAAL